MTFCSALSSSSHRRLLLEGKRVLITGGGRGIGRAISLICHEEGAKVVITSRTQSELEETVRLATATVPENGDYDDEEKKLRLKRSAVAATLLSRRGGKKTLSGSANAATTKATSVGARRTGSATKARTTGRSSISQLVDAVKTGSSTTNNNSGSNNDNMVYYVCDTTNESEVESTVQEIVNTEGEIDILINNAGGSQYSKGPVGTLGGQDLESLLKLNVVGPQLVTAAVCRHSSSWTTTTAAVETAAAEQQQQQDPQLSSDDQKVVLNISSKAGKVGLQNNSFYVASKFALEGLTSSWSKELASNNIRVHSLSPGMVDTQSFPKPPGKKGVRTASSIKECLLFVLTGVTMIGDDGNECEADEADDSPISIVNDMMKYTGHYIHVDEFDQVIREKGVKEAQLAWKPIDEHPFRV